MTEESSSKFLVPGAIVVAGVLVAGAIYAGGGKLPSGTGTTEVRANASAVTEKDHIRGSRNAELVIIEYSDTECPFCKVFHNTMRQVVGTYGGRVAWVYRHFPIPKLHTRAMKEAEATECVAELGGEQMFWTYLDSIFDATNSNDSLDPAELPKLASALGINETAFNECLSVGRYTTKIEDSMEEAVKAGARGTPYSVIISKSGKQTVINGAESFEGVKAKIDSILK